MTIYPNDHRPAHVHVIGDGKEAVFGLNCPDGPPVEHEVYGFGRREIARIKAVLIDALRSLCAEWEKMHGRY